MPARIIKPAPTINVRRRPSRSALVVSHNEIAVSPTSVSVSKRPTSHSLRPTSIRYSTSTTESIPYANILEQRVENNSQPSGVSLPTMLKQAPSHGHTASQDSIPSYLNYFYHA